MGNLKKFKKFSESNNIFDEPVENVETDPKQKQEVFISLNRLGKFLVYDLGLMDAINKIISDIAPPKDWNGDYQKALSLLYKTNKFNDIMKLGNRYESFRLKNKSRAVDDNGEWHPINKLNTNWTDLAKLITDLFEKMGLLQQVYDNRFTTRLKSWLLNFKSKNNFYDLIIQFIGVDELHNYVTQNRKSSEVGEAAEDIVSDKIREKGAIVEYQGGDGDWIDILFGSDLIISKDSKMYLVQVKSEPFAALRAFKDPTKYKQVDWFVAPKDGGIIIYSSKTPDGKIIK